MNPEEAMHGTGTAHVHDERPDTGEGTVTSLLLNTNLGKMKSCSST